MAKESTNPVSKVQTRIKVQEILQKNLRSANGLFHAKELNERGFLRDLFNNFELTPLKK